MAESKFLNKQEIAHLAFEHSQEGIFVFDSEGTILFSNPVGSRYFGKKVGDLVGKNLQDFLPPDQFQAELAWIHNVIARNEPVTFDHSLLLHGKTYHFFTRRQPLPVESKEQPVVMSFSTDITEKVELEEKVRLLDESYREMLAATQNAIWEEDFSGVKNYLESLKKEGVNDLREYFERKPEELLHCADLIRVTDVNLAGRLVYGIDSKEDLAAFRIRDNLTEESLLIFRDEILALANGETVFEARMVTQHPTIGFVHSNMHVTIWSGYEETWERVIVTFADVTLRERYKKELVDSEERYRSLFEYASDAIFLMDAGNVRFVDVNLNAQKLLGYTREEFFQLEIESLVATHDESQLAALFEATKTDRRSLFETILVHKDGSLVPVEISSRIIKLVDHNYVLSFVRDISDRYRAEAKIQRQLHRISVLREIDRIIASSLDLPLSLGVLLEYVLSELEVDAADVLLYDPTIMVLEVIARRGFRTPSMGYAERRNLSHTIPGEVAMRGEKVFLSPVSEAERKRILPLADHESFHSYAALPLIARGETKGVLELFHRTPLEVDDGWMGFAEALAGQAAIAIENIMLFQELKKANLDLSIAYDTTLEGWSRALELFDHDTEGHTRRVTDLTEMLATALNVPDTQLVHMRRGALLHDIGKIAIPGEILNKAGELTAEEQEIVQQHPLVAQKLLVPIPFLKPALDIPYCHHEKWDGSGYPRGLKGEDIPMAARIFSVVDVWDALTTDRPYRKAWTQGDALDYIRTESGRSFDPAVVEVFLQIAPTLR